MRAIEGAECDFPPAYRSASRRPDRARSLARRAPRTTLGLSAPSTGSATTGGGRASGSARFATTIDVIEGGLLGGVEPPRGQRHDRCGARTDRPPVGSFDRAERCDIGDLGVPLACGATRRSSAQPPAPRSRTTDVSSPSAVHRQRSAGRVDVVLVERERVHRPARGVHHDLTARCSSWALAVDVDRRCLAGHLPDLALEGRGRGARGRCGAPGRVSPVAVAVSKRRRAGRATRTGACSSPVGCEARRRPQSRPAGPFAKGSERARMPDAGAAPTRRTTATDVVRSARQACRRARPRAHVTLARRKRRSRG